MSIEQAVKKVAKAIGRLASSPGRIARRNARKAAFGAIKALKNAVDAEYPLIEKEKKAVEPAPAKPKYTLPFARRWDIEIARLFVEVWRETTKHATEIKVRAHEGAVYLPKKRKYLVAYICWFNPQWSSRQCWLNLVDHLSRLTPGGSESRLTFVIELWREFWTEDLALGDIQLFARHQALLDKKGVKRA